MSRSLRCETMTVIATPDPKARYLAAFETLMENERAEGRADHWLNELRRAAIERFQALGFPTLRDEGWRRTNLSPLLSVDGQGMTPAQLNGTVRQSFESFLIPQLTGSRLTFVNGHYAPELSSVAGLPEGVQVRSLREATADDTAAVRTHLGQYAKFEKNVFTALNTAFSRDGAFIFVPSGVKVEEPVHLLFVTLGGEAPAVAHPRTLVVAEAGAEVTLIEHYVGNVGETYFNNPVTEMALSEGAHVDHYKVQQESTSAFHMATMQVEQEGKVVFSNLNVALGGKLARSHMGARLGQPNIETTLNGLLCIGGDQQVDNETVMEHAAPNCASHEIYTGVLDGRARANFTGKIFVHRVAQKTDAKQTNRSLLLSADATADSKPQLEIFADDVRCTHGATIGQLDDDAIFYLRARGIDARDAKAMLILAFVSAVTADVQVEPLREMLNAELFARLSVQN